MLSTSENLIVIDGQIRTDLDSCRWDTMGRCHIVFSGRTKEYTYGSNRVLWLTNPERYSPDMYRVVHRGKILTDISDILKFRTETNVYWHIRFENGSEDNYNGSDLKVSKSCLTDSKSDDVFQYLQSIAAANALLGDDNISMLSKQYNKIDFIDDRTVAASYLNPAAYRPKQFGKGKLIYPFGCNASQLRAVQAAFEHQVSVIQGPPGTGKTQTILNIIANILVAGKSVLVVSNNNSATENILEKLNRYGLVFLIAPLGKSGNKQTFIDSQKIEKKYPDNIRTWRCPEADRMSFLEDIGNRIAVLNDLFAKQERLAVARQELHALETEYRHFGLEEKDVDDKITLRRTDNIRKLSRLWIEFHKFAERRQRFSESLFLLRIVPKIEWQWLEFKSRILLKGLSRKFFKREMSAVLSDLQTAVYNAHSNALHSEIEDLEAYISLQNADDPTRKLSDLSMKYLKNRLYHKFKANPVRRIFESVDDLRFQSQSVLDEYPIILSTTFSARNSLSAGTIYDYVIMDEASQVSIDTGALALSCALNAVIVGDSMQLPNVRTGKDKVEFEDIEKSFHIAEAYKCSRNSFLESVCKAIPDIPQTLLKEHYRCHPKIIDFCNQKFYGGNLVIMTQDNGEPDVICAYLTVEGNHAFGHINRREIDVIREEVLPTLDYDDSEIGIITPYNNQVDALRSNIGKHIDIATVHKFQGREKDAIIMSVVDNRITDFADDPNLLNVAISRAKRKFCLVVNGNERQENRNISDLLAYIEYNNFTVTHSKIHSIFDYLYKQYTEARIAYIASHPPVSEYPSENLLYALIRNILKSDRKYATFDVLCHFPLRSLIRDVSLLDDAERRYVLNGLSHVDFLIYNRVGKSPLLAIEADGYIYHLDGSRQKERDTMKNHILGLYGIPLERLSTKESNEERKIKGWLDAIVS